MAIKTRNPFEGGFENLSSKAGQGIKQIKKQVGQAVSAVAGDVKQQVTGLEADPNSQAASPGLWQQLGLKPMPEEEKAEAEQKRERLLAQTRQNLQKINDEIDRIRRERLERERQRKQEQAQEKQRKKQLEEQQKAEPIWKRMLRGSQGAREGNKHVSG